MKSLVNILSAFLLSATTLVSCHREDLSYNDITENNDIPIEFSIINAELNTKSGVANVENEGFHVWASRGTVYSIFTTSGDDVTYDQTLNSWKYSPIRYWQPGTYNFYAVSPASLVHTTSNLSASGLSVSFDNWDLSSNQKDFMLATESVVGDNYYNVSNVPDPVRLTFDHMLSQISFSARNADPNGVAITVKEVKVYGNSKTATRMSRVLEDNSYKVKWELANTTTSQAPFKALSSLSALLTTGSTVEQGTTKYEYTSLCPAFMFFPEQCDLTFEATIAQKFTNSVSSPEVTKSVTIQKPQNGWGAGKIYNYKLKITAENIVIDTEPEVMTWVTKDDKNNDLVVDGPIVM